MCNTLFGINYLLFQLNILLEYRCPAFKKYIHIYFSAKCVDIGDLLHLIPNKSTLNEVNRLTEHTLKKGERSWVGTQWMNGEDRGGKRRLTISPHVQYSHMAAIDLLSLLFI